MSIYQLLTAFLLTLYAIGFVFFGVEKVLWQTIPAVLATVAFGMVFDFLETKRWAFSPSVAISGLIIGLTAQFLEKPPTLFLIGFLAMAVKFLIKLDGGHIFNPAASGLFLGQIFFSSYPSWWAGGVHWAIFLIWIPILMYKLKRWAPIAGFILPLVALEGIGILTSSSLLFFTSVMLIEPKTSPARVKPGLLYGFAVAVMYLIFKNMLTFDSLIISLLLGNLIARLLPKFKILSI